MREIELLVDEALAEPLSDALLEAGALSVTVSDADAGAPDELALFGEPGLTPARAAWRRNVVVALLADDADDSAVVGRAWTAIGRAGPPPDARSRDVPDEDWVRLTQAQFAPVRVGSRLWIVPSWHEPPPDPAAVVVRLDPGVAFGTGTHPTTRLCLGWLESQLATGSRVMDYGCGSGVLSIAASRLGAGAVAGVDIDEQAVAAARGNAARNGVVGQYTAAQPGVDASGRALEAGAWDVVLANILTQPLVLLAPLLTSLVRPGGYLVLSGILERQAPQVIAAYASVAPDLPLDVWQTEDGWVALVGRRGAGASD